MSEFEKLKESILKDAPRFTEKDKFKFSCHQNLSCFTRCCADVNIVLTPYDILRLKRRLGISSGEFLEGYAVVPFSKEQRLPVVFLKMKDDDLKRCPFLGDKGCEVYEDRPWSCRMYPVGVASPKEETPHGDKKFYFLLEEGDCKGFTEEKEWTIAEWLENQGILEYDEMGEDFKNITLHDYFQKNETLNPDKMELFFLGCYDLDKYKRFVFESKFLEKFDVEEDIAEKIRTDDVELMKFAFRWLRFALFGEPTIKINEEELRRKQTSGEKEQES